jgi:hypothetical protein
MAANGISNLSTKQLRQEAKLDIAEKKRQGYTLNPDGSVSTGPDVAAPFYRVNNAYDRTLLPTQYFANVLFDNNTPLIQARPWSPTTGSTILTSTIRLEDENILTLEDGTTNYAPE